MTYPEASILEIKVEGSQLEFLEKRAKELGLSKEELVKRYIVSDMVKIVDVGGEMGQRRKGSPCKV